jgi:hypothetical protein
MGESPTSQLDSQAGKMFGLSGQPGMPGAAGSRPSTNRPMPTGGPGKVGPEGAPPDAIRGPRTTGAQGRAMGSLAAAERAPFNLDHYQGGRTPARQTR